MNAIDRAAGKATIRPMKPARTNGALLPRRFRMVLVHLAEGACRDLELLPQRPVHAIHALRTRMKQLRAIVDLVRESVSKKARKEISASAGKLKDAFSKQRDAHVIATLRASFGGKRQVTSYQRQLGTGKDGIAQSELRALSKEAAKLSRMVSRLDLGGLSWQQLFDAYVRAYGAARKGMKACTRKPTTASLHKWRRPVKDLFFQSQVLRPIDGMKRRTRLARRLGDRLGEFNDLDMLGKSAAAAGRKGIIKRIAKRKESLRQTALKAGAKLLAQKPREIARELESCLKHTPRALEHCLRQA